ncbi:MAG: YIEGIA family protein [Acetobacteraceae bacterium]|nr:YIEGIA family protein [Acetobacteraceae bacterium]
MTALYGTTGAIGLGLVLGSFARWLMLRVDYRNYPSYPHGYVTHLALGVVAAFLGAVAVPALLEREFTAVTFLALATQQFREVRSLVRDSLHELEEGELVRRGQDYIEGIARVYEARNYLTMVVSVAASGAWLLHPVAGVAAGSAALVLSLAFMRGRQVGQIAVVRPGALRFQGPSLFVEDVYLMNVGLARARARIKEWGLGVVLDPKDDNARDTLASPGQRQAILHDAVAALGVRKDVGVEEFTPLARRSERTGRVALVLVPMEPDIRALVGAVKRTPVLEASRGTALRTRAGRLAAD